MDSNNKQEGMSRRDFLKISASVGVGLAIGASGMAAIENAVAPASKTANGSGNEPSDERIPMYGEHQAGIITPQQTYMYLASFRLTVTDRDALIKVLRDWTKFSDLSTAGGTMRTGDNPLPPPSDTGETLIFPHRS